MPPEGRKRGERLADLGSEWHLTWTRAGLTKKSGTLQWTSNGRCQTVRSSGKRIPISNVANQEERRMEFPRALRVAAAITAAAVLFVAWSGVARSLDAQTSMTIFQSTLAEPDQKTAEVSTDELRRILADRSATVSDARPPQAYAISHVPGAVNLVGKPGLPAPQYVPDTGESELVLGGNKLAAVVLYCSGPFCGRSKRLSEELLKTGFTNVRRYQLGIPVWRALGGPTQIELDGILHVFELDRSAVFVDAREHAEFQAGSLPRAVSVPASELERGKDV